MLVSQMASFSLISCRQKCGTAGNESRGEHEWHMGCHLEDDSVCLSQYMIDVCECSVVCYVSNDANVGGSTLAQHVPDLPAVKRQAEAR